MKEDKTINLLKKFGLNENESKVYFAFLPLGLTTIQKVSQSSGVKRSTVYDVVESLQQKGLVRVEIQGYKKRFAAENPKRLSNVLKQQEEDLKSQMPDLLSLYNTKQQGSIIKYYKGEESLKGVYEDLVKDIKPGEDYLIISNGPAVIENYGKWFENFIEKRSKLNIQIRAILQDTLWARENQKTTKKYNMEIKVLPKGVKLDVNSVITPQRILINQTTKPVLGIVIENKSVINMQKNIFELLWNSL